MTQRLENIYFQKYGYHPDKIEALKSDGSDRKIYRISRGDQTVIGIIGDNREENEAFLKYSKHFRQFGLNVPEIYAENIHEGVYLEEDLGYDTLFSWMMQLREQYGFTEAIKQMYRATVEALPHFQITAGLSIDYSYAYQHTEFAHESMSWDLHYFKNHFLNYYYKFKIDHSNLEKEFNIFIKFLLQEKRIYFLYRDFQSRNVMIKNHEPYFIDYQSGRRGALQYDLGSLLYDAKANLPDDFRQELVEVYLAKAGQITNINAKRFKKYFFGYVLIRIMQAFGAYGYLSAVKGKKQFLKSVPYAVRNLESMFEKHIPILDELTTLKKIFGDLIDDPGLREFSDE